MSGINEIKRTEAWAYMMGRMTKRLAHYMKNVVDASRKYDPRDTAYAVGVHDGFELAIDALTKEGTDGETEKDLTH